MWLGLYRHVLQTRFCQLHHAAGPTHECHECERGRTTGTRLPVVSPWLSLQHFKTFAGLDDDAYVFVNNLMDLLDTFDPEVPQLLGNGAYGFHPSSNPNSGQATRWPIPLPLNLTRQGQGLDSQEQPPNTFAEPLWLSQMSLYSIWWIAFPLAQRAKHHRILGQSNKCSLRHAVCTRAYMQSVSSFEHDGVQRGCHKACDPPDLHVWPYIPQQVLLELGAITLQAALQPLSSSGAPQSPSSS